MNSAEVATGDTMTLGSFTFHWGGAGQWSSFTRTRGNPMLFVRISLTPSGTGKRWRCTVELDRLTRFRKKTTTSSTWMTLESALKATLTESGVTAEDIAELRAL